MEQYEIITRFNCILFIIGFVIMIAGMVLELLNRHSVHNKIMMVAGITISLAVIGQTINWVII